MTVRLANFDIDDFLARYWQKKPLLIRDALENWSNPLEPDELAGLACEPGVESRLVTTGSGTWNLEEGPLAEDRFGQLGSGGYTLLVQAVDHHVPEVAEMLAPFRFVPNWRIEDVMVSYADDGGGVGPHFDQYDVFLVQGLGQRRWQVGALCGEDTELLRHDDLRLLANFEPLEEWILKPGDILYLPPRIAHNGVAVGDDCMTYSIGFRAPSRGELIAGWSEDALVELDDDDRYTDPDLCAPANPGEITDAAIARLQGMIAERLLDRDAFARWFGQFTTEPKSAAIDWQLEHAVAAADVRRWLSDNVALLRNPASRTAFVRHGPDNVSLFVDGKCFACAGEAAVFAQQLCANDLFTVSPATAGSEPTVELIAKLLNQGSIALDAD